jgi:beta-galactosidase
MLPFAAAEAGHAHRWWGGDRSVQSNEDGMRQRALPCALWALIRMLASVLLAAQAVHAQSAAGHPEWPGKGQLFVGTCYQPIDRTPEEIHRDIALMKGAGFNLVRMGDLSWDAFEPAEGRFVFAWFDRIMDEMAANGIKVILDIGGLPAPLWLHHKYPGSNIVAQDGFVRFPAERYMEDISDPDYRRLALAFADALTGHYARHPALLAIGYDNEIGNGFMSYSAADRVRFIDWVKAHYGTIEAVNKAWATQRWSRRLSDFEEIELPYGDGPGPVERYLDLHHFWSDQTVAVIEDLEAVRKRNIPNVPAVSNLWDTSSRKGFDYLASYKQYVSYGAEGFYPHDDPVSASLGALLVKGDLPTPIWFNEFTAGGAGDYGAHGRSRMWAYLGLINQAQTVLAWTFNSHLGGEEQALFGLLDHDGTPSWRLGEFAQIASEFRRLQKLGFPRLHKPEVALAYSFDSRIASNPPGPSNTVRQYYRTPYTEQVTSALRPFFDDNIDTAVINLAHDPLDGYRMLVIAGDYVMDRASAAAIRRYVEAGGTVVMTAYSAKVDEQGQWFGTPLPGRLSDVFGLRTNAFYRADAPLLVAFDGKMLETTDRFYEVLEPDTAQSLANFVNTPDRSPAMTLNRFGKGTAIYLATPAQPTILRPLVRSLYARLGIERGPNTPAGVYARNVEGRTLYVNTTTEAQNIATDGTRTGLITGRRYSGTLRLEPYGVDLVQMGNSGVAKRNGVSSKGRRSSSG